MKPNIIFIIEKINSVDLNIKKMTKLELSKFVIMKIDENFNTSFFCTLNNKYLENF